jgi:phage host-nuclease inhibitor protein Gam
VSTTKKLKTKAAAVVPQSRDDCAAHIARLGELQRDLARMTADMNDALGAITASWQPQIDALTAAINNLQQGVQTWCEAHRDSLTDGGKTKTANLVTGEVAWRQRPPSVQVRGSETVIDTLRRMGLGEFVRSKDEVNKEAILNEPQRVRGIAGIAVVTGVEDFTITPFEQAVA